MLVIGIPTYNEADNIQKLVRLIDSTAERLCIDINIINSDNNSPDGTSKLFEKVETKCTKYALKCGNIGKGRNIHAILEKCLELKNIDGLLLIDGDVTSFDDQWLYSFFYELVVNHTDFCIPLYSRNFQEGNTTNHFIYPLLYAHSYGNSPRQPICGDFGLSKKFIDFILKKKWNNFAYGYGVDIFLTMNAMFHGYYVSEVKLNQKVHKPSFGKMSNMFLEVSSCYYEVARNLIIENRYTQIPKNINLLPFSQKFHFPSITIDSYQIFNRIQLAKQIYSKTNSLIDLSPPESFLIGAKTWNDVLVQHERLILKNESQSIASSILPWYLMRVAEYLQETHDPIEAEKILNEQVENLKLLPLL